MSEMLGGFTVVVVVVVSLLMAAYGPAWGESRLLTPPIPAAPAAPAVPGTPRTPSTPAGHAPASETSAGELALAFLFVGARTVSVEAVGVRLEDALIGVFPDDRPRRREDVARLATLLIESLQRRRLEPDASHRLAVELADAVRMAAAAVEDADPAMAAPSARPGTGTGRASTTGVNDDAANQLELALARVRDALMAAGLGTPEIVLIQREVRRLAEAPVPRPPRSR